MIDRDQVLHVARLARLELSEEEIARMAPELSKILEHVETMNEIDLDGVEPTSHVVDLVNVLREDVPRESLPRERALEQAPDSADGGFRVPTPRAS
jgi:aspartyl-tRNA(Asn)/glutamyl-tRNA(Gln) amidotransferase subunit C